MKRPAKDILPLISILCAVRDEIGTIDEHLHSLVSQTYPRTEIVIVDDESTDGTSKIAQNYAHRYTKIRYFRIKHKTGGSHTDARIFGIAKLRGKIFCIVDSDAYYTKDYLILCYAHLQNPKVGGVIGRMVMWNPSNIISKYREAWYSYRLTNYSLVHKLIKEGKMAAWVFKRSVYEEVGGYDPKNRYGEDVDLAKKIQEKGYSVIYEPKALWRHKWEDTFSSITKKFYMVGQLNYYHRKKESLILLKVGYFSAFIPLFFLSFFSSFFLLFLLLHPFPLFAIMLHRLYLCRKTKYRQYILFYPIMSYITNIPYSLGFITQFAAKEKK